MPSCMNHPVFGYKSMLPRHPPHTSIHFLLATYMRVLLSHLSHLTTCTRAFGSTLLPRITTLINNILMFLAKPSHASLLTIVFILPSAFCVSAGVTLLLIFSLLHAVLCQPLHYLFLPVSCHLLCFIPYNCLCPPTLLCQLWRRSLCRNNRYFKKLVFPYK